MKECEYLEYYIQNQLTHTDDDDSGGLDAFFAVRGFAFVVASVVGVDVRDAQSAAVDGRSGAVLSDDHPAFLLQDGRFVFVPAEAVWWRVARHLAPQFDTFTTLASRVAQWFQHPESACILTRTTTCESP